MTETQTERRPEDRTYDNAEDWVDLLHEAHIYPTEIKGDNHFAWFNLILMKGPFIIQAAWADEKNGRMDIYPVLVLPPGMEDPFSDPEIRAGIYKAFYIEDDRNDCL